MQDLSFVTKVDGTVQRYVQIEPPGFDAPARCDLMVALHGHGSDRWQYARDPRPECAAARDVAREQAMLFVSPDYRATTSWMGPAAEADVFQLIGELRNRYALGRVFVVGGSMGGTSALIFAARHPRGVDGVVSHNGTANMLEFENFQDAVAESYGGTKAQRPEVYRERSVELMPQRLTMPVAVTTGGLDTVVPPDSVFRLVERLRDTNPRVLHIHREEGGHGTDYPDARATIEFVVAKAREEGDAVRDAAGKPAG